MMLRFTVALAACAALCLPPGAAVARAHDVRGDTPATTAYGVDVQRVFDPQGNPVLVGNFAPDGSLATPTWERCDPDCRDGSPGSVFEPGAVAPGTFFRTTAVYEGQRYSADTPAWGGQVTATAPPVLSGPARVGATVRPIGATWSGGWADDASALGAMACRTASMQGCRTLLDHRFSTQATVRVPSWAVGWRLFATDARFAAQTAYAGVGYGSAGAVPPVQASQIVAVSAPGEPVQGPPAPRVVLRRRAAIRHGRIVLGVVRYARPCRVRVSLQRSGTGLANLVVSLRRGGGPLAVPAHDTFAGVVQVTVSVDDGPSRSGTVRVR